MDRVLVYQGALPQTTDILNTNKFGLVGLAALCRAAIGTNIAVSDLVCTPTSPTPNLIVNVGVGSIYAIDPTDATAYGDLGVDNTVIVKQGILQTAVALTITPPVTPGFSQVYLIQAILNDADGGNAVLPYYNAANSSQPFSGPQNSGTAQYTIRTTTCAIALKTGAPAPTGTELVPAPDPGYVGLYTIDVPNGATQITAPMIIRLATAPFFPTLPQVPPDVQTSAWTYAPDTGTVNNIVATVYPPPAALVPGLVCVVKVAFANTGSATLNLNGLGAVVVHRATGAILTSGDIAAGAVVAFMYDGSAWQVLNFTGATTGTVTNIFQSFVIPYGVAGGTPNALTCTFSPAVTSLTAGLVVLVKAIANNTGATTLTPNTLATTNILENQLALLPAAIVNGELLLLVHDGTSFQKVNARNQFFSWDISSPPAPLDMRVGDQANITFSSATSVPLNIITVPGIYEIELMLTSNNSSDTDIWLLPNNTQYGQTDAYYWNMMLGDSGAPSGSVAPDPETSGGPGANGYPFAFDLFGDHQSSNNDRGPCITRFTCSTFAVAKMVRCFSAIAGGPQLGLEIWTNTSTPWTSLGTFQVYRNGFMGVGWATLSGVAIVRRLA